jgi:putative two-component system response regulator
MRLEVEGSMHDGPSVRDYGRRPEGSTILVAEDDPGVRALVCTLLGRAGYRVLETEDGLTAVATALDESPDLILLDIQMAGADGVEVTRRLRARPETALTPIILLTALDRTADKVLAFEAGATDFVTKPFDVAELLARVGGALRTKQATDRLEDVQAVLVALAATVEAKDPTTGDHCSRLAEHALGLARLVGLDEQMIEAVGYGAVLHDIGKIGVAEAILNKPGGLDPAEWAEMRRHPLIGAGIVEPLRLGRLVAPIVRGHHERWDGTGYPDGHAGQTIPIGARLVTVVDAYDAITHDRPYRAGRSTAEARSELLRARGSQFDPELVDLFLDHLRDRATSRRSARTDLTRGLRPVDLGTAA